MRVLVSFALKGLVVIALILAILIGSFCACNRLEERQYYSDMKNYISSSGTVINIIYGDDSDYIVLWLDDYDEAYEESCFNIEGNNAEIALNNGFVEHMEIGCEIEFVSAPRYFGDGYIMPIVALTVDGVELLNFDEGYENLMKSYR